MIMWRDVGVWILLLILTVYIVRKAWRTCKDAKKAEEVPD